MEIAIHLDDAAELLARLVACPSVNPGRRAPPGPPFGEGAIADLLASHLCPLGAEVRKVEISPGRFNLLARFAGGGRRTLMLEAHADTVPAEGMAVAPFDPAIRGGKLFGRGSCDTKASMAAMLLAIRSVVAGGAPPAATLYFVATGDEELGATGAASLVAGGFRADAAVVGEPTDLQIVYAHKGAHRLRLAVRGRAAHGSRPAAGTNAIARMARAVEAIEGPLARELAGRGGGVLGPPTVNVGVICGGTQVNVVPDRCEIEIDRRTLPGENREGVMGEFRRLVESLPMPGPPLEYDLEELEWWPAMEEPRDGRLARLVESACASVLGRAQFVAAPWTSNAGIFRRAGIPSIVFGPGSGRQAHAAEEFVDLDQVVLAARVYAEIIRRFGAGE
jgi:acetylornithine deacetylase